MPLYEYACSACGTTSEISHRMSDPAPVDCPACGAPKLSKQISAAAFRLKGSGWYETDFKSGEKRNIAGDSADAPAPAEGKPEAKAAGAADAKTEGKAAGKADAKPDAKPESKKPEVKAATPGSSASPPAT